MRDFPDQDQFFTEHMIRDSIECADALLKAGIDNPSPKLLRTLSEQAYKKTSQSYIEEMTKVRDENISIILENQRKQLNSIKRSGMRLRSWTCPLFALFFGALAWWNFSAPGTSRLAMGIIYSAASLAFVALLILGDVFDRPQKR